MVVTKHGNGHVLKLSACLADHPDATLVNAETDPDCSNAIGGLRIATGEGVPWSDATTFVNFIRVGFVGEKREHVIF